jgi:hypothetical protein
MLVAPSDLACRRMLSGIRTCSTTVVVVGGPPALPVALMTTELVPSDVKLGKAV